MSPGPARLQVVRPSTMGSSFLSQLRVPNEGTEGPGGSFLLPDAWRGAWSVRVPRNMDPEDAEQDRVNKTLGVPLKSRTFLVQGKRQNKFVSREKWLRAPSTSGQGYHCPSALGGTWNQGPYSSVPQPEGLQGTSSHSISPGLWGLACHWIRNGERGKAKWVSPAGKGKQ